MPMIRLYIFLLDFLILFLCDPDLQCMHASRSVTKDKIGSGLLIIKTLTVLQIDYLYCSSLCAFKFEEFTKFVEYFPSANPKCIWSEKKSIVSRQALVIPGPTILSSGKRSCVLCK
jgi:hypothetical protein